jgi:hypothetical protein
MHLRPYQSQLVAEIRGQYQLGHKAVLAVLPTGGGKTVCFSYIAQSASVKGNRVLILVHRQELLDQASRAMPVPHGIIAANRAMDLSHAVLTSEGYLAPARVLAPPGFDSAGLRKRMGDFDTKQAEQRVGTIMGDCLGHYRKHLRRGQY